MKDLRELTRMAFDGFEQIYKSCGFVEEKETKLHKHAKQLSTCVRADCKNYMEQLRQALAQSENPPVKSYCGGKPNYCTPEVTPDVDAVNISQKRVDETAKGGHDSLGSEWAECVKLPIVVHVRKQRDGETHISTREGITPVLSDDLIMRGVAGEEYPIGRELFERTYTFDTAPPKREWVGLTEADIYELMDNEDEFEFAKAIEAKLKEKNT